MCVCESVRERERLGGMGWLEGGWRDEILGRGGAGKVEERKKEVRSCYHALINPDPRDRPVCVCVCVCVERVWVHVLRDSTLRHVHICVWNEKHAVVACILDKTTPLHLIVFINS